MLVLLGSLAMVSLLCGLPYVYTGLPTYSDRYEMVKKCHCKRGSLYPMIFSGPTNCHCIQLVTLTGVAIGGEACTSGLEGCFGTITSFWMEHWAKMLLLCLCFSIVLFGNGVPHKQ